MKRGLVVLDPAEIPPGELEQRVGALQAELRERGLAAALVYADVYHSGDLGYLSNICLYWNEALLAVPADGRAALLTKLSPRVANWWRATSNLEDFRSGRVLAKLAEGFLAEQGPGGVGLVELDWWPDQLLADVTAAAGGREITDLGSVVRRRRQVPCPGRAADPPASPPNRWAAAHRPRIRPMSTIGHPAACHWWCPERCGSASANPSARSTAAARRGSAGGRSASVPWTSSGWLSGWLGGSAARSASAGSNATAAPRGSPPAAAPRWRTGRRSRRPACWLPQ